MFKGVLVLCVRSACPAVTTTSLSRSDLTCKVWIKRGQVDLQATPPLGRLKERGRQVRRRLPCVKKKMEMNGTELHLTEYGFERRFDERGAIRWMQENWSKSFMFCALYAALVFTGQHYMKPRPKMNLRLPLVLWSLSLAVFSIIGAVRTGSYMMHILSTGGFRQSICDQSFYNGPISKFWAYAFVLSKAPELGDTAFIVLRKQKLLFLHWYHHITVLLYSWYSYKDMVAGGGWFMTMNYTVHALMYSYYAARAAGLRVPRPFAVLITSSQIAQMVMGVMVSALVYRWMQQGGCPSRLDNITWATLMYLSYLLLFSNFFYQTYLRPPIKTTKTQ